MRQRTDCTEYPNILVMGGEFKSRTVLTVTISTELTEQQLLDVMEYMVSSTRMLLKLTKIGVPS